MQTLNNKKVQICLPPLIIPSDSMNYHADAWYPKEPNISAKNDSKKKRKILTLSPLPTPESLSSETFTMFNPPLDLPLQKPNELSSPMTKLIWERSHHSLSSLPEEPMPSNLHPEYLLSQLIQETNQEDLAMLPLLRAPRSEILDQNSPLMHLARAASMLLAAEDQEERIKNISQSLELDLEDPITNNSNFFKYCAHVEMMENLLNNAHIYTDAEFDALMNEE